MSVYVDDAKHPYGRMVMCHMVADTSEELKAMATAVGVKLKWIQSAGTYREHFDICKAMRDKAVALGAREITQRELGQFLYERNPNRKPLFPRGDELHPSPE